MSIPSIAVLLNWPVPNWKNPETTGPTLYIVTSIFIGLATIAVGARFYTRILIRRYFGWDDILIALAWIINAGNYALQMWAHKGLEWDRHSWDTHLELIQPSLKALLAAKILWVTGSMLVRMSLLVFFHRLLDHIDLRRFRPVIWANMAFVMSIWLCYAFTDIFNCVPVEGYWVFDPNARCINSGMANIILSCFNTLSEFLVALMPVPVVFRVLPMKRKQRWNVISLLSLGFLVTVAGIVRTYFVYKAFFGYDLYWWSSAHWSASEVEVDLAMICSCAPALRPFIGRAFAKHKHVQSSPKHPASSRTQSDGTRTPTPVFITSIANKLHSKRKARNFEKDQLASNTSSEGTVIWAQYDIEGIRADGYGYTVNITAEPQTRKRRKAFARKATDSNEEDDDWEGPTGLKALKNVLRGEGRGADKAAARKSTHRTITPGDEEGFLSGKIVVAKRQSLEVRHSLGEKTGRGFDYRNPFVRPGEQQNGDAPQTTYDQNDATLELADHGLLGDNATALDLEKASAVEDFVRHYEKRTSLDNVMTDSKIITQQPFTHNTSAFMESTSTLDMNEQSGPNNAEPHAVLMQPPFQTASNSQRPSFENPPRGTSPWPFQPPAPKRSNSYGRGNATSSPGPGMPANRYPSVATSPINSSHQWVFNQGVSGDGGAGLPTTTTTQNPSNLNPARTSLPRERSATRDLTAPRQSLEQDIARASVERPRQQSLGREQPSRVRQASQDTAELGRAAEGAFMRAWTAVGELDGQEVLSESERAAAEAYSREAREEQRRQRRREEKKSTSREDSRR